MIKTPEELTEKLKAALGATCRSVVLFGSAAADDRTRRHSDFNILVVLEDLD